MIGFPVTQEAISTGDPELVQLILRHREMDAMRAQAQVVPRLLEKLREVRKRRVGVDKARYLEVQS